MVLLGLLNVYTEHTKFIYRQSQGLAPVACDMNPGVRASSPLWFSVSNSNTFLQEHPFQSQIKIIMPVRIIKSAVSIR